MRTLIAASLAFAFAACAGGAKVDLNNQKDKLSYGIGMDIGRNLKKQNIDIKPEIMAQGLKDVIGGTKLQMTDDQVRETMMELQKDMMAKRQQQLQGNPDMQRQHEAMKQGMQGGPDDAQGGNPHEGNPHAQGNPHDAPQGQP